MYTSCILRVYIYKRDKFFSLKLKAKSRDYDAISHILYRFTDEHFSQTYAYCAQHVLTKRKKKDIVI